MTRSNEDVERLVNRAADGDQGVREELMTCFRDRLKRMVRLRLNRQLHGRVDESDIVQEASMEAARRLDDYLANPPLPFYLWLRHITGRKLIDAHRFHLGKKLRDAAQEVSLQGGPLLTADSVTLAAQLLGKLTGPVRAAIRAETRQRVAEVLNRMGPIDQEILALRHFEQMTNAEIAHVLELSESTTSSRYLRALDRLRDELIRVPGLFDE